MPKVYVHNTLQSLRLLCLDSLLVPLQATVQNIHHDTWKEKKNKFVIKLKVQSKTSRPLTHQMGIYLLCRGHSCRPPHSSPLFAATKQRPPFPSPNLVPIPIQTP
jgi:hypothetical protein